MRALPPHSLTAHLRRYLLTTHLVGAVHLEVGHGEGRLVHGLLRVSNGVRVGLGLQAVHRDLLTMALLILTMALTHYGPTVSSCSRSYVSASTAPTTCGAATWLGSGLGLGLGLGQG